MTGSRPGGQRVLEKVVLVATLGFAVTMLAGGFWQWPWDHDEVLAFAELNLVPEDEYVGPPAQLRRIRVILPVWYHSQRLALSWLPHDELGARVLPVGAALVLVGLSAWWAMRRDVWFATSVVLLAGASPMLVWLAQQNRFYSLALCFMAGALYAAGSRRDGWRWDVVAAVLCLLSVLTHNLTVVVFILSAVSAVAARALGPVPALLLRRTGILAALATAVYLLYLRPELAGWVSGDTGGTPPIVSFAAQMGLCPLGLAVIGTLDALGRRGNGEGRWWVVLSAGALAFVVAVPALLAAWNPRYALFFMWPVWIVAAMGMQAVCSRLGSPLMRAAFVAAVAMAVAPKLMSHLADGTRHDFRAAAAIVAAEPGLVVSNWPATLQYYLKSHDTRRVQDWRPGAVLPNSPVVVALASNAWEPVLNLEARTTTVLGEVATRRFDEQSHVIRIYRVAASEEKPGLGKP